MVILADELTVTAGDDFARRVGTVPGLAKASGIVNLAHPEAGELLRYWMRRLAESRGA